MANSYRPVDRDQQFLLPEDMGRWLGEDHLVWLVIDVVDQLDTSAFHRGRVQSGAGRRAYDPDMLLALLMYAYASGERSSRRIERLCTDHVAFRVLCAQDAPDHCTIARFRAGHSEAFEGLFAQVLKLCSDAGMGQVGSIAIDGTKIAANAARGANRSAASIKKEAAQSGLSPDRARSLAREILADAQAHDEAEDAQEAARPAGAGQPGQLPEQFATRAGRKANLAKALEEVRRREQVVDEQESAENAKNEAFLKQLEADPSSGRAPAGLAPADVARARIIGWQNRIASLEGVSGKQASKSRGWAREYLKRAQRSLAKAEADLAAGIEPDLRSKSALRRAGRAKARGQHGDGTAPINITDPDSRLMTEGSGGGSVQGYNAQFAVSDDHLVVGIHVSQCANDASSYQPTLDQAAKNVAALGKTIDLVLADAGYFNKENLTEPGPERLIAPGKNRDVHAAARNDPAQELTPAGLDPAAAMRFKLRQPANIERYKRRGATVEPVFGHLKEVIKLRRFSGRGLPAITGELNLAASMLNLLRLQTAGAV